MVPARRSALIDSAAPVRRITLLLAAILAAGFAARVGIRLFLGEAHYWQNNYALFYTAAERLADGGGFCTGTRCARPPIYVAFLAFATLFGKHYLLIVVPQALIGTGTAFIAFLIGRDIFNARVGLLACAGVAFYPYYVMHDTALQDTAMVTFCIALSVWLLLRARNSNQAIDWALAGVALGVIALVRASAASIVPAALLWTTVWGTPKGIGGTIKPISILLLTAALTVAPWLTYTYRITGAPVLSTDSGYVLWIGNNPDTFSHYPAGSIDRSRDEARSKLSEQDRAELHRRASDHIATGNWFYRRAVDFVSAHPGLAAQGVVRKLAAAFSWTLNPRRGAAAQWVYALSYTPVAVLGIAGMVMARRRAETALVALLFLAFMAVTAVFWAHTSHRVHLDIYWIVFGSAAAVYAATRLTRRAEMTSPDSARSYRSPNSQ